MTEKKQEQLKIDVLREDDDDIEMELSSEEIGSGIPFDPTQIRIDVKPFTVDLLITRIRYGELDLNPGFQRDTNIWNSINQSRLIESLLIRIPLPTFYIDATNEDRWVVVDGLQRLNTFKRFIMDEEFPLTGLEYLGKELDKRRFTELPRNLQRRILETQVTLNLIQKGTPEPVKFNIFKRINTGGAPLNAQEIRHALHHGRATDFLKHLTELPEFKTCLGSISKKRMQDREFALRFIAFTLTPYTEYRVKDMDLFLIDAINKLSKLPTNHFTELENDFVRALNLASAIFGNNAFRKINPNMSQRSPINRALFEAWAVSLGMVSPEQAEVLVNEREYLVESFVHSLTEDPEFLNSITFATGDVMRVQCRFETVGHIISATLFHSQTSHGTR